MAEIVIPKIGCVASSENYGRFVAEPLESGFGVTVGNALRRVLLSSLEGAAVTWVRIEGVQHEFSTIPYAKEDTPDFLLNVKEIRVRSFVERPGKLFLEVEGEGEVTAGDIQPSADFEVVNPGLHLLTLDSPQARLAVEFNVERGKGYVPATYVDGLGIGVIPVDAFFTPVRKVNYKVEHTRVGQLTNYDRLILEVWTDGTISAVDAISQSAQILLRQFSLFSNLSKPTLEGPKRHALGALTVTTQQSKTPIEQLGLSVRAYNCLKRSGISTLGEILTMSEDDLLAVRNFGRKSLEELKERLRAFGVVFESESETASEDKVHPGDAMTTLEEGVAETAAVNTDSSESPPDPQESQSRDMSKDTGEM